MRRIPVRFWGLALLLIGLNLGCWLWVRSEIRVQLQAQLRPATVVATLPHEHVDDAERLSIVFDGPVVDANKVGKVEDAPLFKISPDVGGEWKWATTNQLDFVLDDPLPAGRIFDVDPLKDIEVKLGRPVAIAEKIEFSTRSLNLTQCQLLASDRESVQFEVTFNQKVAPRDLLKYLTVQVPQVTAAAPRNGVVSDVTSPAFQILTATCVTNQPATRIVLRVDRPQASEFQVVVAPELKGFNAEKALGQIARQTLQLPRSLAYLRTEIDQPGLDASIPVRLKFSESLNHSQTLPPITLEPPVKGLSIRLTEDWGPGTLILQGEFVPGSSYEAKIGKTLLGANGQTLRDDLTIPFTVPQREPMVRFGMSNGILSPNGHLQLDVETVNVGHVKIRAHRVHANNLVPFLHEGSHYRDDQFSRTIIEKSIAIPGAGSEPRKHVLDLRQTLGQQQPLGTYLFEVRATDQTWERDYANVIVTDLGLIVKQDRESLWVWVSSLKSANPVEGVRVSAISETNQTLVSAVTDGNGIARLPVDSKHPDGSPWVVVAEKDQDLVYQRLGQQEWVLDHIDQSGRPHPGAYDVLMYTERGVYRPGDTLHVTGLIRDREGVVPPSFPLSVRVTRPDGRIAATLIVTPPSDQQGTFHFEFPTREDSQTGAYSFVVSLPGATESLGKTTALVEAFVPARIEVQAQASQPKFKGNEKAKLIVSSRYLFGQPASDLPFTVIGKYQFSPYRSKSAPDFQFQPTTIAERRHIEFTDLKLDAQGRFEVELAAPPEAPLGIWKAHLATTVTEPGGRSISKNVTLDWDTADRHLGLKAPRSVTVGQDVQLEIIQLTGDDAPATAGTVQIALSQIEYETVARRTNGSTEWISHRRETGVSQHVIAAETIQQGLGKLSIKCLNSGYFRLVATDQVSGQATELEFYARGSNDENQSLALDKPERLELILDQPQYVPGSTAKVIVNSPFPGTLIVCMESDQILEQRVVKLTTNTTTLEIPVPSNLRGGAFLTAAVVRPLATDEKSWLPHRAMGIARIITDHSNLKLPLQIEAPASVRPNDSITVKVQTTKPEPGKSRALVHLWAVDEGVLLTTGYETPDPLRHFLAQRVLGVTTQDVYSALLPDHQRPVDWSRIGGDGEGHEAGASRRSLVPPKKFETLVLWQGFGAVDDAGQSTFQFQLPNFTGELRFMATAVQNDQYGSASSSTTISSPLMLEASWPRFAAPGDDWRVPVKLFNSTEAPLTAHLNLKVNGPVTVTLPPETGAITVHPKVPVTVWLPVRATGMGMSQITLTALAQVDQQAILKSELISQLPVRPGLPLHSVSTTLRGVPMKPLELTFTDEFEPGTATTSLKISPKPSLEFLPAVDVLLDYPYGCVEQTTSRLWALLTAHEILIQQDDRFGRREVLDQMLLAGVHRLWAMQTPRGGLGYWPGDNHDHHWGTVYAAEFLSEAAQSGIAVDSQFKQELISFLSEMLHERNGITTSIHAKAQICHVLAKFHQPEEGWMTRLSEQTRLLDMESRAELAQAWNAIGRKDKALQLLTDETREQAGRPEFALRITSPTQQTATLLIALLDIDKDHPWIPGLVSKLLEARKHGRWGNTAENARALRALLRFQGPSTEATEYTGVVKGLANQSAAFSSAAPFALKFPASPLPLQLETSGTGSFFVTATTAGIMKAGLVRQYDRQIQVRRAWTDRHGQPIKMEHVKVGDLINVQITLKSSTEGAFDPIANVAIVDALPAGFEVENPRLMTSAATHQAEGQVPQLSVAEHIEFLDDRVILFTQSRHHIQTFQYSLRAVASGRFIAPPIQASCMYDDEIASVNGGGKVEIKD